MATNETAAREDQCLLTEQKNRDGRPEYDESLFREVQVYTNCPYCNEKIVSQTRLKNGRWTYLAAACLCVLQCYCCLWIPFVANDLKNIVHECPKCGKELAEFKRCRLLQRKRPKRTRDHSLLFHH